MFKMPTLLPYPIIPDLSERPELKGLFCYIIRDYTPGRVILIARNDGDLGVRIGDWSGVLFGPSESRDTLQTICPKLVEMTRILGIPQAQFFLSSDGRLVDVQLSLNKFLSPGTVRDLFARQIGVQEHLEITVLTPDKLREIKGNKYGRVILKPSRFRFVESGNQIVPLYATMG